MADFFVLDVEDLPQVVPPQDGHVHTLNVSQSAECESLWTREQAIDYGMTITVHAPEPILLKGVGGSTLYVESKCTHIQ